MKEILTPSEVAALLRIHVRTVYKLAAEGVIPGNRIGRSWRFNKRAIIGLLSNKRGRTDKEENSPGLRKNSPIG